MKTKPAKNQNLINEWRAHGIYRIPDDVPELVAVEKEREARFRVMFDGRLKRVDHIVSCIEFGKTAPSDKERIRFLEYVIREFAKEVAAWVHSERTCFESFDKKDKREIERLKCQPFN